ncbi:MAG: DedA family protein [Patescibacteria group bacterium]
MQELIPQLIQILHQYGYIFVFFGTIIGGEVVILAASFLAFLGFFNIFTVMAVALAGTILSDSLWYYIGFRGKDFISKYVEFFYLPKIKFGFFQRNFNHHYGRFLIFSKFIYGTRTATMIASGHQQVGYKKFLKYNLIGTVIWLIVVVGLGYLMGFSWRYLDRYSDYARYWTLGLLTLVLIIRFIFKRLIKFKEYEPGD